jgi:hypothetical protein
VTSTIIKKQPACFLSRKSALQAVIREGRRFGLRDAQIMQGKAVPLSKRGEHLGWAAYHPQLPTQFVMEN